MNQNNDQEFENLFKRAAEQYPLDTDTANWDAVLSKLEESEKKKPFWFFTKRTGLTVFLILLVGFISSLVTGIIVWHNTNNENEKANTIQQQSKPTLPNNTQSETTLKVEKKIADEVYNKVVDQLNNQATKQIQASKQSNKAIAEIKKNQANGNQSYAQLKKSTADIAKTNTEKSSSTNSIKGKSSIQKQIDEKSIVSNEGSTKLAIQNGTDVEAKEETASIGALSNKNSTINNNVNTTTDEAASKTNATPILAINKAKTDTVKTTDSSSNKTTKVVEKKKDSLGNKYFYAGLLYARDKSTIGFEPNKGRGYSYQLLVGYRLSNRLSFETGIHLEKKELYTTNDTYYKDVLRPAGTILWIESESRLIEIPLTVKYDMLNSKKHNFFGTLGISSYITNSEHLEYEEELNGVTTSEYLELEKRTSDLFASSNFSLGYQYTLGKKLKIRVEPYINLPIKGIGKGEAPIVSKGVYIGLIYQFQKKMLKQ